MAPALASATTNVEIVPMDIVSSPQVLSGKSGASTDDERPQFRGSELATFHRIAQKELGDGKTPKKFAGGKGGEKGCICPHHRHEKTCEGVIKASHSANANAARIARNKHCNCSRRCNTDCSHGCGYRTHAHNALDRAHVGSAAWLGARVGVNKVAERGLAHLLQGKRKGLPTASSRRHGLMCGQIRRRRRRRRRRQRRWHVRRRRSRRRCLRCLRLSAGRARCLS